LYTDILSPDILSPDISQNPDSMSVFIISITVGQMSMDEKTKAKYITTWT
jgi:hypothetical protein